MAGLNLDRIASRLIFGHRDLHVARLAMDERGFPQRGPSSWIKDRFLFMATVTSAPVRYRGIGPAPTGTIVYDPASREPKSREYRRFFIEHYFGEEIAFLGRHETPRSDDWKARLRSARWYSLGIVLGLFAFLDWSPRRYRWLAASLLDIRAYVRALDGIDRAFVFAMYDRRSYLIAGFLHRHTNIEVIPVYQNVPLQRNCRYLHMRIPIILTSKVNLHEAAYFRAKGGFLASEFNYRPQEFLLDTINLERQKPSVDIGFFSSGEWARREGLYQVRDPEIVSSGVLRGSAYDIQSDEIVRALAAYAQRMQRSLVIYPHPFERTLMRDFGIAPPYADLDDGTCVRIDDSEGLNSRSRIYECEVAVSLQSSFIWERLDLDLEKSFIFEWSDGSKNPFLREALGPYSSALFRDVDELIAKLDNAFADSKVMSTCRSPRDELNGFLVEEGPFR